jgi:hypothetical protein
VVEVLGKHPSPSQISRDILQHSPQKYRPDIDGLRALAVMAVIVFHAFPNVVPGGFVGVDVFFVVKTRSSLCFGAHGTSKIQAAVAHRPTSQTIESQTSQSSRVMS